VIVALTVLAGLLVVAAIAVPIHQVLSSRGVGTLASGPGTGTIHWQRTSGCVTPFSGSAAGLTITGTATSSYPSGTGGSKAGCVPSGYTRTTTAAGTPVIPSSLLISVWQGSLGGTPFDLRVTLDLGQGSGPTSGQSSITIARVQGTFGGQPVDLTVTVSSLNASALQFSGVVGGRAASGTVTMPSSSSSSESGSATFTITG